MDRHAGQTRGMFFLWVDEVGGFWVCIADEVVLGQAVPSSGADIPIMGDLSKRHARIRRDGESYLLEAIRDVRLDGRPVERVAGLGDENMIEMGAGVKVAFRRPHPLSATARLDFASGHRTQPFSDSVLLMADTCVLGPRPTSHVFCRQWPSELVLYRHADQLYCRSAGSMEIDGKRCRGRSPITQNSRIVGDRFSVSLEPI
jgi:hypothetical protein